jgi:hypothetical protein
MKKYMHLTMVVFLILVLLVAAVPASAEAIKTEMTGTMRFTGELEPDPDLDDWSVGKDGLTIDQFRNDTQYYDVFGSDERFNGFQISEVNGVFMYDTDGYLRSARLWEKTTIYTDLSYTEPKWECSGVASLDSEWNLTLDVVCQGVGVNKGLKAKLTCGNPIYYPDQPYVDYPFEGYILDPGGE